MNPTSNQVRTTQTAALAGEPGTRNGSALSPKVRVNRSPHVPTANVVAASGHLQK